MYVGDEKWLALRNLMPIAKNMPVTGIMVGLVGSGSSSRKRSTPDFGDTRNGRVSSRVEGLIIVSGEVHHHLQQKPFLPPAVFANSSVGSSPFRSRESFNPKYTLLLYFV